MKRAVLALILLTAVAASAQLAKIVIPAGTSEDQAIQALTNETDSAKRIAMLQDFVQKFASNPQAACYGNWQLSQQYLNDGDAAKALEFGEKALAVQPNNLDILVSVAGVAQQLKQNDKVIDFATSGGKAFNGIARQTKPAEMSDADFAARIAEEQSSAKQAYEYLEVSGLNAIIAEQNAKPRMTYIERYIAAFPGTRFEEQIMQYAIYTIQQLNDSARLVEFAEKAVTSNPNSASTYVLLANAFAESQNPAHVAKAEAYAQKALQLAKADAPGADAKAKLQAGLAHSALGFALLKQEKTVPAIAELKLGSTTLKGDSEAYSTVLYRLGFAYAKTNKLAEAKTVLTEAVGVQGPFQQASRELLSKVDAAPAAKRKAGK